MKHILTLSVLLLLISSCNKTDFDTTTIVDINIINPVTKTGYENVTFSIFEANSSIFGSGKTTMIYSGKTDVNGKTYYKFDVNKNHRDYTITFDYSKMLVPENDYDFSYARDNEIITRGAVNNFNFEILPYFSYIKNINCFDENDKMRFRTKHLFSQGTPEWSFWDTLDQSYSYGCKDVSHLLYKPQDIYIYEVESTKNGILSTYIDTFKAESNLDTFKIYY